MLSKAPLFSSKEFSKYCFSVMTFPSLSSNLRLKSLKSHNKVGKYWANSASFSSKFFFELGFELFFIFIVLLKLRTKLKVFIAVSSIAPNELYINKELINTAMRNILLS